MSLTTREEKVWQSITEWESGYFEYEPTDFEATYDRWVKQQLNQLNPALIEKMNDVIDSALFHVHALIQNSRHQMDVRERLLSEARVFNPNIDEIEDLKACTLDQLTYIAHQQIARSRMLSLAQGGLSGTGGLLLLGIDIPAMIALQIRSIQSIAMNYGYDIQKPSEMMMSLKVFHASTLPKRYQHESWNELFHELSNGEADVFFYVGDETVADVTWLSMPLKQGMKGLIITMLKKKVVQGIPVLGVLFGATMNYQKSREVTEFAHKFYQKRFLIDRQS